MGQRHSRYRGGRTAGRGPRDHRAVREEPAALLRDKAETRLGQTEGKPDDLTAYDDAGVACDRLDRDDEAIGWMDRKRQRLEALEAQGKPDNEHRYRYLANVGTFWY